MDELEIGTRVEIVSGEYEGRRGDIVYVSKMDMSFGGNIKRYTILLDPIAQETKPKTVGLGAALLKVID